MLTRRACVLVAVLALGATVSGCGKDEKADPKPTGTPTVKVTGPGSDTTENFATGREFFAALATNDPARLREVTDLVDPGSGAAAYLDALINALADAKKPTRALALQNPTEGVYRLCPASGPTSGKDCTEITGVVLVAGKVSVFKLDGKRVGAKTVARGE